MYTELRDMGLGLHNQMQVSVGVTDIKRNLNNMSCLTLGQDSFQGVVFQMIQNSVSLVRASALLKAARLTFVVQTYRAHLCDYISSVPCSRQ